MQFYNVSTRLMTSIFLIATLNIIPTRSFPTKNQTLLHPRAPPTLHISDLQLTLVDQLPVLLPLSITAKQLENFYTVIASKARNEWLSSLTPSPILHFGIQWGALQLNFVSNAAEPPLPIPWTFIADFAEMMIEATRRGWMPGGYHQTWWDQARTWGIYVGLRIISAGGTPVDWVPVYGSN